VVQAELDDLARNGAAAVGLEIDLIGRTSWLAGYRPSDWVTLRVQPMQKGLACSDPSPRDRRDRKNPLGEITA